MKIKQVSFLFIALVILFTSCSKDEDGVKNTTGKFTCGFYADNKLVAFKNDSDNLDCTRFTVAWLGLVQIHGLSLQIGNSSSGSNVLANCLRFDIVNYYPDGLLYGVLNESQFDNILSVRDVRFLDVSDYMDAKKEGVLITYYDKNGVVWTTADFDSKFNGAILANPKLDYDSFSFKIASSSKSNVLIGEGYARNLELLFNCELVNSKGEKMKMTFGKSNLIYQYNTRKSN